MLRAHLSTLLRNIIFPGGPGCSGLLGNLAEIGPFRPAEGGDKLDLSPYSWTKSAALIFVEQPLFVGFSISDDLTDSNTDDDINGRRLVMFIERWFERFPDHSSRDFYLASECRPVSIPPSHDTCSHLPPSFSCRLLQHMVVTTCLRR
jgi:hypothetical protein